MALQENQIKPLQLDYVTIREMLPTATRDRVLGFIGQQHPGDIAVLFKGLEPPEVRQTFRHLLFHSQSVEDTESAPTGTYQGLIIRFGLRIVAWVWKGNAALGLVAGLTMFLNMLVAATGGALVPTALRKLGFDPATVAGVFDTMLTDFIELLIFPGLATFFIHYLT